MDEFSEINPRVNTNGIVFHKNPITDMEKASKRNFFDLKSLESKAVKNMIQRFMQTSLDEEKPSMNRENFMVLLDNEGEVSSGLLKREADRF
jgi:hypothetical protein